MDFIQQVRSELNKRITKTDYICERFQDIYNGYSYKVRQIFLLVLFGLIVFALIWAMIGIDYGRNSSLALLALASVCLYIALHIYKNAMHIIRIGRIYKLKYEVGRIKSRLQANLNNIMDIAANAKRDVFGQTNKKLEPNYDIEADIAKYDNILKSYQRPDDNVLNIVLIIAHWLSGILFTSIFLFISTPFVAEKIYEWIHLKEYSFNSLIYISGIIALYMIFQELFAKISMLNMHIKIKTIFGYFFIVGICGLLLYVISLGQVINLNQVEIIHSMSLPYTPLVICAFFLSVICYTCKINERIKRILGYVFIVGIYVILMYLILGLKFISFIETIDKKSSLDFIVVIFLIYVPLMMATLSSSIISIIYKIKNKVFSVMLGSSVFYTILFLISDAYTNVIQTKFVASVAATFIALLPGLVMLGIAGKIAKQKEESILHLLITFLVVVGFITVVTLITTIPATIEVMPGKNKVYETSTTGTFTDYRNGKTYKTTKIGSQTWFAENLNYDAKGSKCYNNEPINCQKYGRLYNWSSAIKACPNGWHLPSNAEWDALSRFIDGKSGTSSPYKSETAGKYLKAKSGWNSFEGMSGNGTDNYSFAALPGGVGNPDGKFSSIGNYGNWWSSTKYDDNRAYNRFKSYKHNNAGWESETKSKLFSVRCVKD